jgi:hypothetical protein
MFKISLAQAIIDMVELALARGDREHALIVSLRLTANRNVSRYLSLFFYRGTNYTTVGSAEGRVSPQPTEWKLEAHHDSCWRADGVDATLSGLYLSMSKEVALGAPPKSVAIEARLVPSPRKVEVCGVLRSDGKVCVQYRA